jgi:hypothetical protein
MISFQHEEVVTIKQAANRLPTRPHISALYRWAKEGLYGVRLETLRVGGKICTSIEALQRFFTAVTEATHEPTLAERRRQQSAAERELIEKGW